MSRSKMSFKMSRCLRILLLKHCCLEAQALAVETMGVLHNLDGRDGRGTATGGPR